MLDDEIKEEIEMFFEIFDETLTASTRGAVEQANKQSLLKKPSIILSPLFRHFKTELGIKVLPTAAYRYIYSMLKKYRWSVPDDFNIWYASVKSPDTPPDTTSYNEITVDDLLRDRPSRDAVENQLPDPRNNYSIRDMRDLIQAIRRLERLSPGPEFDRLEAEINEARERISRQGSKINRLMKIAEEATSNSIEDSIFTLELNFEHESLLLSVIILKQLFPSDDIINQDYVSHLKQIIIAIADSGKLHVELVSIISNLLLQQGKVSTSSKGQQQAEEMLFDASRYDEIVNQLFGDVEDESEI